MGRFDNAVRGYRQTMAVMDPVFGSDPPPEVKVPKGTYGGSEEWRDKDKYVARGYRDIGHELFLGGMQNIDDQLMRSREGASRAQSLYNAADRASYGARQASSRVREAYAAGIDDRVSDVRGTARSRADALASQVAGRADDLVAAADRRGRSAAEAQLQAGLDSAQRRSLSMAGSARGGNRALAMRQAMRANEDLALQTNQQAAQLRATEEAAAINRAVAARQAAMAGVGQALTGAGQLDLQGASGAGQLYGALHGQTLNDLARQRAMSIEEMKTHGTLGLGYQGQANRMATQGTQLGLAQQQAGTDYLHGIQTAQLNADMGYGTQVVNAGVNNARMQAQSDSARRATNASLFQTAVGLIF